jgi:hypothetical protein
VASRQVSTLEIASLSKELRFLEGFHIDKFYQVDESRFRIKASSKGEKVNLGIWLCRYIGRTETITIADKPTNFSIAVRRRISGFVVDSVVMLNSDRIIEIKCSKGQETKSVIFEMFGRGNIILCDGSYTIELAYAPHTFKDRAVKKGATYAPPKNARFTLAAPPTGHDIAEMAKVPDASIISAISKNFNIGSVYIEDALMRCGIDPKAPAVSVGEDACGRIAAQIKDLLVFAENPKPRIYSKDGAYLDYGICGIMKYEGMEMQEFATVQEMLERYYASIASETAESAAKQPNRAAEETRASIEKQKAAYLEMQKEIEYSKAAGQKIFQNMDLINRIIAYAREKKKFTKEDIESSFPGIKVIGVDLKDKKITIDI